MEGARRTTHAEFGGFQVIKIVVHAKGQGTCAYSGKEDAKGLVVTFEDGTLREEFVSERAFLNFIKMKLQALERAKSARSNGEVTNA